MPSVLQPRAQRLPGLAPAIPTHPTCPAPPCLALPPLVIVRDGGLPVVAKSPCPEEMIGNPFFPSCHARATSWPLI